LTRRAQHQTKQKGKAAAKRPAKPPRSGGWLGALFKWVVIYGVICGAACLVAVYAMILYLSGTLTDPKDALVASGAAPIQIVASTGEVLANYGPNQGDWVDYADIPPDMIDAMIAIEDRRFFQHGGLDFRSIARAALSNVRAGGVTEGGSTITQQVAKSL